MITKKCRDCGKEFTLTDGEINFYRSKGFELPNRCKDCRSKRKKAQASYMQNRSDKSCDGEHERSFSRLTALTIAIAAVIVFAAASMLPKLFADETEISAPSVTTYITESASTARTVTTSDAETEAAVTAYTVESESTIATENEPQGIEAAAYTAEAESTTYRFRNENLLNQHYEKHGIEMGFSSAAEYESAAAAVISNDAALHKLEKEDGDDIYYLESTNDFVIVSTDGYIRTYFRPDKGKDYYDSQ